MQSYIESDFRPLLVAASPYTPKSFLGYLSAMVGFIVGRKIRLTNWKPGSRIRTLIEAIAFALARSSAEFFAGYQYARNFNCYESFGFDLLPGLKASGFIRYQNTGHISNISIPILTISLFGLTYHTIAATTLNTGDTFVDIDVVAGDVGTDYNLDALAIDTDNGNGDIFSETGEELTFERIFNPFEISGGTEIESEQSRQARWKDFINNLARSTMSGIRSGVKTVAGVVDSYVTENINPYTGDPETGWINIYVSDGTAVVSPAILQAVEDRISGVLGTDELGYRAGGTRLYVSTIAVQAININYELDVLDSSLLTDPQIEALASIAITKYVNRQPNGGDVLLDLVKSAGISAHPDFLRIRLVGLVSDISVPDGSVPKIGGTGGGTITCSLIARIPRP